MRRDIEQGARRIIIWKSICEFRRGRHVFCFHGWLCALLLQEQSNRTLEDCEK